MDYYLLTDVTARIGYELALSGAETFRIEETMRRIMSAYGVECETFAIPSSVMISIESDKGKPIMIMRRVGFHGNDLESVERLNSLARRICAETPNPAVAIQWLEETLRARRKYSTLVYYIGNFLVAAGFCPLFGGDIKDSIISGFLALIIGAVTRIMNKMETNPFFSTIAAAFLMAVPAYVLAGLGVTTYSHSVIIGALMLLVPGLLITNSMRDVIYGDTNSGIIRIVQVLLYALAIALGTAAAWHITEGIYGVSVSTGSADYPMWAQAIGAAVCCAGFAIIFNVHDWGVILCIIGGVITWMSYLIFGELGLDVYQMNFLASVIAAIYAEGMARKRRYPVLSYLVISTVPLLPGAGIYYTMSTGIDGNMISALQKGLETAGIAGCIAVAILLVSTIFRLAAKISAKRAEGK